MEKASSPSAHLDFRIGDIKQFGKGGGVDEVSLIRRLYKNEVASRNGLDGDYMPM